MGVPNVSDCLFPCFLEDILDLIRHIVLSLLEEAEVPVSELDIVVRVNSRAISVEGDMATTVDVASTVAQPDIVPLVDEHIRQ